MKTSTRKRIGRVGLLAVLALLLLACFASCAPNNAPKVTLSYDGDTFLSVAENQDQHALKGTQLKSLADLLVATFDPETFDNREMLVAAWRGYDMLAEGFDDTKINETAEERAERDRGDRADVAAAVKVITKANDLADEKTAVDFTALNKADLDVLIDAFRTKADVDSSAGFMDKILSGIGVALRWLTNTLCFGSYLGGICLFAIIIEILMLPFAIKQQKNSIRQAKLRPKEMAIKNKYKGRNDQPTMQKMQQEIQELYQRENFSPYSGCLPLLIQLPIIMALYSIIIDPLHYVMGQTAGMSQALTTFATASRAAGGLGCVFGNTNGSILLLSELKSAGVAAFESVSSFRFFENSEEVFTALSGISGKIPSFSIGGINFGLAPSFSGNLLLLLVPVLTFVTYFLTSKLNRKFMAQPVANEGVDAKQVACSNTMMDVTMPMMSTFFTFMVPALVGVYWMFRSLVGLGKQFIISRIMPLPTFTEEDYKQAAKEMAGKRTVVKKSERAGSVRSLHHIDDEDYEDTRERALARKAAIEAREREEQEAKKSSLFGGATLKQDRKAEDAKDADDTDEADQADKN
ncbi:MAG: membrane protein insertase YidC [Clostridia bacterium]|nr:membrane protein insertase YidC [Clostridia bacterium]MBQ2248984.1 membrane protein insertase YidC [Clostridia bacterium]